MSRPRKWQKWRRPGAAAMRRWRAQLDVAFQLIEHPDWPGAALEQAINDGNGDCFPVAGEQNWRQLHDWRRAARAFAQATPAERLDSLAAFTAATEAAEPMIRPRPKGQLAPPPTPRFRADIDG